MVLVYPVMRKPESLCLEREAIDQAAHNLRGFLTRAVPGP